MFHIADWAKLEQELSHHSDSVIDSNKWGASGESMSGGLEKGRGPEPRGVSAAVARLLKKMGSVERVQGSVPVCSVQDIASIENLPAI